MKRFFGCHVSLSGGITSAIAGGERLGVNTIQIHPSPPQRWNSKPFAEGIEGEFLAAKGKSCVEKVFFHGIYLINLANPDSQKFHLSKLSLVHYLDLCARVHGDGVIFHVGSNKDQPSEEAGHDQAAFGVNWVLKHSDNNAKLLLEVAAGSGKIIGDRMEELAYIFERVEDKERVGFALDTQHMWASGYDFASGLDKVVAEIEGVLGLGKVWAIHLNDSMSELGSKKDRHQNLGDGTIGADVLRRIVGHPKLANIPLILETPALKDPQGAEQEVRKLTDLIEQN
jgi:deoxyribonuclease IV